MRTLYHLWLSPFSRKIRIALAEKKLDFELKAENPAERRAEFLALNPACDVPVLVEDSGPVISNSAPTRRSIPATPRSAPKSGV